MTERAADPTPEAMEAAIDILYTDDRISKMEFARDSFECNRVARALDSFAQARVEAAVEKTVSSLVNHWFAASNAAAFWDSNPRPWRVEEDWACEITAANGNIVAKLPYPRDLRIAHAVVEAANVVLDEAETDAEIEAILGGEQP